MFNAKRIRALESDVEFSKHDIRALKSRLSSVDDVLTLLMDHLGLGLERVPSRIQVNKIPKKRKD